VQKLLIILLITFIYSCSTAQPTYNYSTKDKKAIKSYEIAQGHYNSIDPNTGRRNWKDAEKHANDAIARDSNFLMPYSLLTKIYNDTYQYDKALVSSKKMLQISPDYSPAQYFLHSRFCYEMWRIRRCVEICKKIHIVSRN
jgi:tetratricopeptide (TPR) repeat protein